MIKITARSATTKATKWVIVARSNLKIATWTVMLVRGRVAWGSGLLKRLSHSQGQGRDKEDPDKEGVLPS